MTIWQGCSGIQAIQPVSGTVLRLVESQEQVATTTYVDTLAEQDVLEALLETSKPVQPLHTQGLHYLLATPFRYPPLKWGSRFGQKNEPSLFYGATQVATALAEASFYRLVYLQSMASDGMPSKPLSGQHTLFEIGYQTDYGIRLQETPFDRFRDAIRHPSDYSKTQQLGADMRMAGVRCFQYPAARCATGTNVALYDASSFTKISPENLQQFISATGKTKVEFKNIATGQCYCFDSGQFMVEGKLPLPA